MVKNLSVFFPCYNEGQNISTTVGKAVKVLENLKLEYEILVINDGSSDETREVAEKLVKGNSRIRLINHPQNLGYGEALKSGFYNSQYNTIVYNDGDGQFDFSEVTKFIEKLDEADLIIGYRQKRADHPIRLLFAKGWGLSLALFFGLGLKDVDCGFKMVKREVLDKIGRLESTRGGMINAELAIKAKKFGFSVTQVGVHHYPRLSGKPTGASIPVIVKSYMELFKLWWKFLNKWHFSALVSILVLAGFFRLWNIQGYMTFLGDEGRDALMIKRILVERDFPLLGPPTSIGNIYLGPLYYYMMAVPMSISWLNPVAAAIQVAVIGILTVFLIYYLGKQWFGWVAGVVSAFLYAISPVTIYYSRSSWNPNPAPFFALLSLLGMYKAHQSRNFLWLLLVGFGVAAAVQMHYLALILLPVVGILWLWELWSKIKRKIRGKYFWGGTILGAITFLTLTSPLLIFDLKYNFLNYRAVTTFFLERETTVNLNPLNTIERIVPIFSQDLISRYMTGENLWLAAVISILVFLPVLITLRRFLAGYTVSWVYLALYVWLLVGILGLALYKQNIYDHYLGFLNPVPYLLLGAVFCLARTKIKKIIFIIIIIFITFINLQKNPLLTPSQNQLKRTQEIAKFVIQEAGGKPFNFALIAKSNYDAAYQFYLDVYGYKSKQAPLDITDQLFVVCEDAICQPVGHHKYEIAAFGMVKVEKETKIYGVRVYKLVHNPSGKP